MIRATQRAAALLLLVAAGCTQRTDLIPPPLLDLGGTTSVCGGLGAPIHLGSSCAGALAANNLGRALCSCSSIFLSGSLFTEDSGGGGGGGPGQGPMGAPGGPAPAAAVASDGSIEVGGSVQINGSLSAGAAGIGFNHTAEILGSLRSAGSLAAMQLAAVSEDAYVAGDVLGRVVVNGTLYVSPDSSVMAPSDNNDIVRQAIAVDPPCGCDAGPIVDVGALVAAARSDNQDAAAMIDPTKLASTHGPTSFDLPCGSYYLPSLTSDDTLEIRVHGRSALYIDGDVSLANGLRVTLDDDAELDLLVAGDVTLSAGTLGAASAAAVRLWLESTSLQLGAGAMLSAIVYAPGATLLGDGGLAATGALFVDSIVTDGNVMLRFDSDVLAGGSACGQPIVSPTF